MSREAMDRQGLALISNLLVKIGLREPPTLRGVLHILVLDDDKRRHGWFVRRFSGDSLDIAEDVATAREFLKTATYDGIFLDHDLLPEHYKSRRRDDERTGYAIALWLSEHPDSQGGATIISHTLNGDGALRMVQKLREGGRHAEYVPFPLLEERLKGYWKR